MNGTVKFVYRKPCGCVMSESALREMRKAAGGAGTTVCPVTGEEDVEEEWVTINPMGDEKECATEAWAALCAWERDEKKAAKELKKRKSGGGADDPPREKKAKVAKLHPAVAPSIGTAGATVPKLSATLAAKIAEQKKSQSAAVASLYAPKDDGTNKDKVRLVFGTLYLITP